VLGDYFTVSGVPPAHHRFSLRSRLADRFDLDWLARAGVVGNPLQMERPSLQRLLEDIRKGLVDVVVVYKVDRLTRSLADFAKMVELFDNQGVSFVAVTQQFNTTISMGRLTLNVLLSFAQFEREVNGDRILDKIGGPGISLVQLAGLGKGAFGGRDRRARGRAQQYVAASWRFSLLELSRRSPAACSRPNSTSKRSPTLTRRSTGASSNRRSESADRQPISRAISEDFRTDLA
jgi:hypothetical protein